MISVQRANRFSHATMVDPIYDEIDRILFILQNDDGSWGTADSLNERIYHTAWALHALSSQGLSEHTKKTISLLRDCVVVEIEDPFDLSNFTHLRKLYGLVMVLPFVFDNRLWKKKSKFLTNLKQILDYVEEKSWFNTQLAAYISFFLKDISDLSMYAERARKYLDQAEVDRVDVFAALGSNDYLHKVLKSNILMPSLESMPDEGLSHLLMALSNTGSDANKEAVEKVKERLIALIQKRQLTELDKRVTKELLDTLLLIRARVGDREIRNRLQKLGNSVYIKEIGSSESSVKLVTEIPVSGLLDILSRIDIVVLSAYILAVNRLGEKIVHIVPQKDYRLIRQYFETATSPVSTKRLLIYESILSIPVFCFGLIAILWLGYSLSIQYSTYEQNLRVLFTTVTYSAFFLGYFALLARLLRRLFPTLSSVLGSKLPRTLASSYVWKKFWGGDGVST
jgi:hypothetical protein